MASVLVSWEHSGACDNFRVYRKAHGSANFPSSPLAIVASTERQYLDAGLSNGAFLDYTVRAFTAEGGESTGPVMTITVQVPAPAAPTNLVLQNV